MPCYVVTTEMSGLHEEKIKNLISQEVMASAREIFEPMGKKFLDQLRVKMLFKLNEEFKVKKESLGLRLAVSHLRREMSSAGKKKWTRRLLLLEPLAKNLNNKGWRKGGGEQEEEGAVVPPLPTALAVVVAMRTDMSAYCVRRGGPTKITSWIC